jgi:hypothetical protein
MKFPKYDPIDGLDTLPRIPAWVTSKRAETLEDIAFMSGSALSSLHGVFAREEVPHALLRDRLAMRAAEVCVVFSGRPERAEALRDEACLLRPGDLPGPAGETCLAWRRAAERPISIRAMGRALPTFEREQIATWLDVGHGAPVNRAALVLEAVLTEAPQSEVPALILADTALSQALDCNRLVPLLAPMLKRSDLYKRGDALRFACHHAVVGSAIQTVRLAGDLARRAQHLKAVVPKLRAKGAEGAVELFLSCDAVAPTALPLADRAARRLCNRLVDLGVIRELTGRDTSRLYGV